MVRNNREGRVDEKEKMENWTGMSEAGLKQGNSLSQGDCKVNVVGPMLEESTNPSRGVLR